MLSLVLYSGEPGDHHASMPRLRIQFHRDLSQAWTGGGGQHPPCCLRPLPGHSLVVAGRVRNATLLLMLVLVLKGMRRFEDPER